MDLRDELIVLCLALLDCVLDLITQGGWSKVQGAKRPGVRVKQ